MTLSHIIKNCDTVNEQPGKLKHWLSALTSCVRKPAKCKAADSEVTAGQVHSAMRGSSEPKPRQEAEEAQLRDKLEDMVT